MGDIYNVGLLATTDLSAGDDRWMFMDAAVFRDLFSLSAANIDTQVIVGVPNAERLDFPTPPTFEMVSLPTLKSNFVITLAEIAAKASEEDTLVIVLCGHGEHGTGNLVLGGDLEATPCDYLSKDEVERALRSLKIPRARTFLVSNACYSGSWSSSKWCLQAAAGPSQTSAAMVPSGSEESRGSIFSYCLLAERAEHYDLVAPHPVRKTYAADHDHRQGVYSTWDTPVTARMDGGCTEPKGPARTVEEAAQEQMKGAIGRTYNMANFFTDAPPAVPCTLPIRPFSPFSYARITAVDASPPKEEEDAATGAGPVDDLEPQSPLSPAERERTFYPFPRHMLLYLTTAVPSTSPST